MKQKQANTILYLPDRPPPTHWTGVLVTLGSRHALKRLLNMPTSTSPSTGRQSGNAGQNSKIQTDTRRPSRSALGDRAYGYPRKGASSTPLRCFTAGPSARAEWGPPAQSANRGAAGKGLVRSGTELSAAVEKEDPCSEPTGNNSQDTLTEKQLGAEWCACECYLS